MLKKTLILSTLTSFLLSATACAEMTPISPQFFKDYKKGINNIAIRTDNETRNYENDILKVYVRSTLFDIFMRGSKGDMRSKFVASHQDGIYRAAQAALGGMVTYFDCIGLKLDITNKTNESLSIDLNKSVISIGSYQGRPFIDSIQPTKSQLDITPPLVIPPYQTVTIALYRGDGTFFDDGTYGAGWTVPCDLSLGKNIFGDGTFIITVIKDKTEFIPMNFYREINRSSIAQYIVR